MSTQQTSFFRPSELHSNTSVLTMLAYVSSGLIRIFEWPFVLWYGVLVLLVVNILLLGKLIYDLGWKSDEPSSRARFWAGIRLLINLTLVFVAVYYIRLQ